MNALVPHTPEAISIGASAMIPRTMRDAMDLANMMARTGFLPKELQNPGGALFVIEQAMRWNMSVYAVAMETSFIQGKPMFSGKIVAAAVTSSGVLNGRLSYEYSGSGDDRTVTVRGAVRGETEAREVSVRVKDVRTQNKVWVTQPDQQLAYSGARVWARRHTPEVMLGVYTPEEFDAAPVREPAHTGPTLDAQPAPAPVRLAAQPVTRPRDAVDDDAIPDFDAPPPPPVDKLADATARLIANIQAAADEDALHEIAGDEKISAWRRDKLATARPELEARIAAAYGDRYAALTASVGTEA